LSEKDRAFQCLERCFQERLPMMLFIRGHIFFSALSADPRMLDLARRLGMPNDSMLANSETI
jgi:hypothetical protein